METITIKIEGKDNLHFFLDMLRKLNFVKDIELNNNTTISPLNIRDAPVEWAKNKPDILDFAGIWKENNITLDELRKKAWKRN